MKAPAAQRKILVLLAGLLWSAVGLALTAAAVVWAFPFRFGSLPWLGAGVIGGVIVYRYGFSKLAKVNLVRIFEQAPGKDKVCVFAFQSARSYAVIIIMMALGYTLRHLPVPRIWLTPVYLTIGLGLFLSSLLYYRRLSLTIGKFTGRL